MRIENAVLAALFITGAVLGMYGFFNSLGEGLGTDVDSNFVESFNKTNDRLATIELAYNKTTQENLNPADFVTDVVLGFKAIKTIVTLPLDVTEDLFIGTDTEPGILVRLGLPPYVFTLVLSGITILVLFALLALLFGRRA